MHFSENSSKTVRRPPPRIDAEVVDPACEAKTVLPPSVSLAVNNPHILYTLVRLGLPSPFSKDRRSKEAQRDQMYAEIICSWRCPYPPTDPLILNDPHIFPTYSMFGTFWNCEGGGWGGKTRHGLNSAPLRPFSTKRNSDCYF